MVGNKELLKDENEGVIVYDGFDKALLGFGSQWSKEPIAVYSEVLMIECLVDQGMSLSDAYEYFDFNVKGMWVGERTPLILSD